MPGEEKTVTFTVTEPMLRFYNANCELVSEKGQFRLMVGCADNFADTVFFTLI